MTSFAQYDIEDVENDSIQKGPKINPFKLKEKIYIGGEFSLRFGSTTYFYVAPFAGYDIYKGLSVGVSSMYQLYRVKYTNGAVLSSNSYGGGIFARYRPEFFQAILFQAEFDMYNTENFLTSSAGDRVNVPALMFGAGYAGSLGKKSYYQIMLMYDLVNDPNMPLPRLFTSIPVYLRYGMVFYLDNN